LNSFIYFPTWRAISGNFLGPKMMRAKKNRKIVSEKLMRFIILPEKEKRQCGGDRVLTTRFALAEKTAEQRWAGFAGFALGSSCPRALALSPSKWGIGGKYREMCIFRRRE
jgi:hypothetical protein